jgi:large-conductance mechanosensitive channel
MADFKEQLTQFIVANNVVGISAGICIGAVTKDAVASLVNDILFPLLFIGISQLKVKKFSKLFNENNELKVLAFIKHMMTWILIVIVTFIFIQVSFVYALGFEPKKIEKK